MVKRGRMQGKRNLFATAGSSGDLFPYLAVPPEMQRSGHQTTIPASSGGIALRLVRMDVVRPAGRNSPTVSGAAVSGAAKEIGSLPSEPSFARMRSASFVWLQPKTALARPAISWST